jgi:hypothetical protein
MNRIEHVDVVSVVVEVIDCLELARRQMKPLLEGLGKVGRTEVLRTLQLHLFVEIDPSEICGRDLGRELLDEGKMNLTLLGLELRRETLENYWLLSVFVVRGARNNGGDFMWWRWPANPVRRADQSRQGQNNVQVIGPHNPQRHKKPQAFPLQLITGIRFF